MKNPVLLSVLVAGYIAAAELKPINIAPMGADLERFPVFKQGELTVLLAEPYLQLRLEKLKAPMVVLNHHREDGSWRLQILPAGDEVWVEKETGTPRYRAACSNRISAIPSNRIPIPVIPPKQSSTTPTSGPSDPSGSKSMAPVSPGDRIAEKFSKNFGDSAEVLAGIIGWLLPLIILLLAGAGAWFLLRRVMTPAPPPLPPPPPLVVGSGASTSRPSAPPAGTPAPAR